MQTRQFSTIGESRCISVTIVNDVTADPGESFRVTVTFPNNQISGGVVAIVIIENDDGKQKYYVNFKFHFFVSL